MRTLRMKRLFIPLLAALCCASLQVWAAFTIEPYIQNPSTNAMTVMWESDALEEASVSVAPAEDGGNATVIPAPKPETSTANKVDYHVYSVRLTDLKLGAAYTYTVKMGESVSAPATFRTFPEEVETFTFIAYGDSRSDPINHKKVVSNFLKYKPAFILHSGDMVGTGKNRDEWRRDFFQPLANVINQVPIFGARGNHEGGGHNMKRFLSPPHDSFGYSFHYGSAHFVCLDMSAKSEDIEWADKDLAASKATWKIPFYHYPNFNIGGHGSRKGRDTLVPMFRKHKVDLAISGHSHLYERFYPLVPLNEPDAHPVTYVVSGGGGAPKYDTAPNGALAHGAKKLHFMVIKVSPETLSVETRNEKDELLDAFTIPKKNGVYGKDYLALVKPEEAVTLQNMFNLKLEVNGLPATDKDITVRATYPGKVIPFPAKVTLALDEGSAKRYTMEPASMEVDVASGKKQDATFTLRAKEKMAFNENDEIGPVLTFERRFEVGAAKWAVPQTMDFSGGLRAFTGWQVVGTPELSDRIWSYTTFDPSKEDALHLGARKRFRDVTLPKSLENWYNPTFDDGKWKTGKAPIGVGEYGKRGTETLKNESEWGEGEFLLMRTTFTLENTDYDFLRIRALAAQGYHVYLNGHKVETFIWYDSKRYRSILLNPKYLVKGANVLAAYCNVAYGKDGPVGQADFYIEGLKIK